jgi:hypothetical protein
MELDNLMKDMRNNNDDVEMAIPESHNQSENV